jgi:urease accessory protein
LLGMVFGVFVVFALAASITLPLTRLWMIIAVRVSGSWLAALGLLLAGWVWRYGARIG